MAEAGADAIIAHVGTTIGGSIGVKAAAISLDDAVKRVQAIAQRRHACASIFLPFTWRPYLDARRRRLRQRTHRLCRFRRRFSLERLAVENSPH